jgi:phage/plasmid-associated DNA primase
LSYYNRDIPEPEAVLVRTEEYREESNEVEQWCKENIEFKVGSVLELTDLNNRRFGPDYQNRQVKGKFKKDVERVVRQMGDSVEGFDHICKTRTIEKSTYRCWVGITLI